MVPSLSYGKSGAERRRSSMPAVLCSFAREAILGDALAAALPSPRAPDDRGEGATVRGLPRRERRSAGEDHAGDLGPVPGLSLSRAARLQAGARKNDMMSPAGRDAGARRHDGAGAVFLAEAVARPAAAGGAGGCRGAGRCAPTARSGVPAATRANTRARAPSRALAGQYQGISRSRRCWTSAPAPAATIPA